MMCIRIAAVGSNEITTAEIQVIIKCILGEKNAVIPLLTKQVTGDEPVDLYVCAITQQEPLQKKVSADRMTVLDLQPTAQFFIDISHIPQGETVYIFNSNRRYPELLREMCHKYGIDNLEFLIIAYEDMPSDEVIKLLLSARYIIGVGKIVGQEVLLSEKYRPYLRPDVKIIGRSRMATMQTACTLLQKVNDIRNKHIARQIVSLSEQLKSRPDSNGSEYREIAAQLERLVTENTQDIIPVQLNLINSFAAQLSDRLLPVGGKCMVVDVPNDNDSMIDTLAKIESLSPHNDKL